MHIYVYIYIYIGRAARRDSRRPGHSAGDGGAPHRHDRRGRVRILILESKYVTLYHNLQ